MHSSMCVTISDTYTTRAQLAGLAATVPSKAWVAGGWSDDPQVRVPGFCMNQVPATHTPAPSQLTATKRSLAFLSVAIQVPPAAAVAPSTDPPSLMLPLLPLPPSLFGLVLLYPPSALMSRALFTLCCAAAAAGTATSRAARSSSFCRHSSPAVCRQHTSYIISVCCGVHQLPAVAIAYD